MGVPELLVVYKNSFAAGITTGRCLWKLVESLGCASLCECLTFKSVLGSVGIL